MVYFFALIPGPLPGQTISGQQHRPTRLPVLSAGFAQKKAGLNNQFKPALDF
jgi:hypothetical protein